MSYLTIFLVILVIASIAFGFGKWVSKQKFDDSEEDIREQLNEKPPYYSQLRGKK